jgi:phosphomannomutase
MKKKVIAFDLDGTLAPSKSPMPDRMSDLMDRLLENYQVCVMSGGRFEQFEKQFLSNLKAMPEQLKNLHLMPTCGTRYYRYDSTNQTWEKVYTEDFKPAEKEKIIAVLAKAMKELGYDNEKTYGETIEDRGSQITLSTLGQDVVDALGLDGVKLKEEWDPDNKKKNKIAAFARELLSEFEVRVGGLTSIDVTRPGIDKAYGIKKLMDIVGVQKEEILFMGDRLSEGGNDYPVKAMGVDSIEVSRWEDTALAIEVILHVS